MVENEYDPESPKFDPKSSEYDQELALRVFTAQNRDNIIAFDSADINCLLPQKESLKPLAQKFLNKESVEFFDTSNIIDIDLSDPDEFLHKAKRLVVEAHNLKLEVLDKAISPSDVYVVWFAKVLQNWKALVSTDVVSGIYYEVTYDGNKKQSYVDCYHKKYNVAIAD